LPPCDIGEFYLTNPNPPKQNPNYIDDRLHNYFNNNTCGGLSGWVGLHLIEKWAILHTCVLVGVFDVSVFDVGVFDVGVFDVGNLTVGKFFFDLDHFNNDSMNVRKLEISTSKSSTAKS
jgi:hypothetical protein